MTEKQFQYNVNKNSIEYNEKHFAYFNGEQNKITDKLNELNDECEFLEIENEALEDGATKYAELYHKSLKENEQLKSKNLILKGKLHQLRLKCGKQEEEIECLSEETIEKFKQDLKDGKFIEYTAR